MRSSRLNESASVSACPSVCTFLAAALGFDGPEVDGRYRADELHWLGLDEARALHVPAGTL